MLNERVSAAKKIAADLHQAVDAIDDAMIRIAQLAATLPTARRETNMSAIVGQSAMAKVAHALAASGEVRQLLTDAHLALTVTQKEVGLGTHVRRRGEARERPTGRRRQQRPGGGQVAVAPWRRPFEHQKGLTATMWSVAIYYVVLFITVAVALRRGGLNGGRPIPPRSPSVLTSAVSPFPTWTDIEFNIFVIDVVRSASASGTSLKTQSFWPLLDLGWQLIAIFAHIRNTCSRRYWHGLIRCCRSISRIRSCCSSSMLGSSRRKSDVTA